MYFINLQVNVPLSMLVCIAHDSRMQTQSKVTFKGHDILRAAADMDVLQTAV